MAYGMTADSVVERHFSIMAAAPRKRQVSKEQVVILDAKKRSVACANVIIPNLMCEVELDRMLRDGANALTALEAVPPPNAMECPHGAVALR